MSNFIETDYTEWSQRHFAMLAEGGMWAVPRSGLVFTRRGDSLVLTSTMPHIIEMPMDEAALRKYQEEDFQAIKSHFEAAGIPVRSEIPDEGN